jgi:hypothetical protein
MMAENEKVVTEMKFPLQEYFRMKFNEHPLLRVLFELK